MLQFKLFSESVLMLSRLEARSLGLASLEGSFFSIFTFQPSTCKMLFFLVRMTTHEGVGGEVVAMADMFGRSSDALSSFISALKSSIC